MGIVSPPHVGAGECLRQNSAQGPPTIGLGGSGTGVGSVGVVGGSGGNGGLLLSHPHRERVIRAIRMVCLITNYLSCLGYRRNIYRLGIPAL